MATDQVDPMATDNDEKTTADEPQSKAGSFSLRFDATKPLGLGFQEGGVVSKVVEGSQAGSGETPVQLGWRITAVGGKSTAGLTNTDLKALITAATGTVDVDFKSTHVLDPAVTSRWVDQTWEESCLPSLMDFVRIPNLSPAFDTEVHTNGLQERALDFISEWILKLDIKGLTLERLSAKGKTPAIFVEVPASGVDETIFMYGHADKQPPLTEDWYDGFQPYEPQIKDGKLYGRGGADDGYSVFAAMTAIKALQVQNVPHPRFVFLMETGEESGSPDLLDWVAELKEKIRSPRLIVCIDSGAGDYDHLWITTSLRGTIIGKLKVQLLKEAVHSGKYSGIARDGFHVVRQLLDRLDDAKTGRCIKELEVDIPQYVKDGARKYAEVLGDEVWDDCPFIDGAGPQMDVKDPATRTENLTQLYLNKTWMPQVSVTGVDGMPPCAKAGNVLRKDTNVKLSIRVPPTAKPQQCATAIKECLERKPTPYGAKVEYENEGAYTGFAGPDPAKWLVDSWQSASRNYYGKPHMYMGEGGSIPFMGELQVMFPDAMFMVCGVLGPGSNAHGPNEKMDISMAKKLTCCIAQVCADLNEEFDANPKCVAPGLQNVFATGVSGVFPTGPGGSGECMC